MTENRDPGSLMERKLKSYYEVSPRPEFLPSLKKDLMGRASSSTAVKKNRWALPTIVRRPAFALALFAVILCVLGLVTPPGRALAQQFLRFFTRSASDTLPVQSWQLTPLPTPGTPTPDPGSILDASLAMKEVETQADFDVLAPSWLPDSLSFAGVSIEPDHHIVRIFYRYIETNGLILREEPYLRTGDCELCGEVGASATVETVSLGAISGEYVEGVWKLTDSGPVWEPDPYLKTLRWQSNGLALELQFMGPPDAMTKEDLIAVAKSLK